MSDLKDFLENIRKFSPKIGEVAMRHVSGLTVIPSLSVYQCAQGCSWVLSLTRLKKQLKGHHFSSSAEVITAAETWLDGQPSEFFLIGLQKLEFGHWLVSFLVGLRTSEHPGINYCYQVFYYTNIIHSVFYNAFLQTKFYQEPFRNMSVGWCHHI